jgi:hypothetical protein
MSGRDPTPANEALQATAKSGPRLSAGPLGCTG